MTQIEPLFKYQDFVVLILTCLLCFSVHVFFGIISEPHLQRYKSDTVEDSFWIYLSFLGIFS